MMAMLTGSRETLPHRVPGRISTRGGFNSPVLHRPVESANYTAMVYSDRITELGAIPSTGTVGDSFDNAMAEAVDNLYKTELIRQQGPWRTVEQVELATLGWVWWVEP